MKHVVLVLFFSAFVTIVWGQRILVVNARTNEPVEGVLVISEKKITTQTDVEGRVDLGMIKQDESVLFQHASYLNFSTTREKIISGGNVVILVEDPVRLDEVVISVNRWEKSKTEIPHKIEIMQAEDVLRTNPQTTADMLGTRNGIFIQKSQMGGGSPMIRGFAANRLLLVVDGIRMNNAIYRSGNLHNVISIDANALDHTEIIFGPGSVIYGSDALGGVMSFSTLKPRLSTQKKSEQRGKVFTRYSSANFERTLHATYNFGSEKWAALVSSTLAGFSDLRMGTYGRDEYLRPEYVSPGMVSGIDEIVPNTNKRIQKFTGYNQFNVLSKLRFRPHNRTDVVFSLNHSQTSDVPRYDRLIVYRNNQPRYAEWYYGPQKWTLLSGNLKYQNQHAVFDKINLLAGYQSYNESRHDRSLNSEKRRDRTEALSVFSLNIDLGKNFNERNEIFYGAEAFLNTVESSGNAENLINGKTEKIAPRYPDGSTYDSYATYISYQFNFNDKVIFHTGARFTHTRLRGDFDSVFYNFPFSGFDMNNSAFNGSLGLVWHPTPEWQVNLNASSGFRSPNIDDVAKVFDSEPGNVIVPNPGLNPEYARNIELGIIRRYAGKARFEVTGYFTRLKNAMVRRGFSVNGRDSVFYDGVLSAVEALINAESARIYGSSFSFEYLFSRFCKTRHNYSLTLGQDAEGTPLRHVPPPFGSSHLLWETESWFVDLYVDYSGSFDYEELAPSEKDKPHMYAVDENGNPWSPAWWTLNVKLNYSFHEDFILSGGVENILDKRYRTYSSGIVAPGINFIFSVSMQF